jgi:hypothetical protein
LIGVNSTQNRSRIYRSVSTTRGAVFVTAVLIGLIALCAVPGRAQVVGYIFTPIWLVGTWRVWRLGVHIEAGGIRVVGSLFSRKVAWKDIDHFEVRPWLRYPYQGHVVLRGGRAPIPILAISAGGRKNELHLRQVQEPIDRLNEALADWRDDHATKADAERNVFASQPSASQREK